MYVPLPFHILTTEINRQNLLPRLRRLRNPNVRHNNPGLPNGGPLGPPHFHNFWRPHPSHLHAHHRFSLRLQQRPRKHRHREMGSHRPNLHLHPRLLLDLGRRNQGLRKRDPARKDEGGRYERSAELELGHKLDRSIYNTNLPLEINFRRILPVRRLKHPHRLRMPDRNA